MRIGERLCAAGILLVVTCVTGCGGSGSDGADASFAARETGGPVTIDVVRDFGAVADGRTDDEPMIQAALDRAATRGGSVILPEGVFGIGRPLIVRSGVHLSGQGIGKSIVRPLVHTWGKIADGAAVTAAIAMIAAQDASVTHLTLDMSPAATNSNGIVALPSGANFEGTPCVRSVIANVEVIGGGDYHAYLIWNLRGEQIRIVNNVVDGRISVPTSGSEQEGIESYGGREVLVGWNVVTNIGNAALNFGSAGHPNTELEHLEVVGNQVSNAGKGLNIGPALDSAGPQNVRDVRITGNVFTNVWQTGISVPVMAGTDISGLHIVGNRISGVGTDEIAGAGVYFLGQFATGGATASTGEDNLLFSNTIEQVRGPNATGVLVIRFPNVRVVANSITGIAHTGVFATSAAGLVVEDNWIADVHHWGLASNGPGGSLKVNRNTVWHWDGGGQRVAGMSIHDVSEGTVRNNNFWHPAQPGTAVRVESNAANVIVFDNTLFSEVAGTSPAFINNGTPSNIESLRPALGETTFTIDNPLVTPTSAIVVRNQSGEVLPVTVAAEEGSIRLTAAEPAAGDEHFFIEIDP